MEIFARQLDELYRFLGEKASRSSVSSCSPSVKWPAAGGRKVVLADETAVEFGGPVSESASFILWTYRKNVVTPGRITVIGNDIPQCASRNAPFGKVLVAELDAFDELTCYDRFREMASVNHSLDLMGCMTRSSSPYLGIWMRISRDAVRKGITFGILGSDLIARMRSLEYVVGCEAIFVTSSAEDVRMLKPIAQQSRAIIGAMNKISEEEFHDCGECDFSAACSEVDALKKIRESLRKRPEGKNE